MRQERFPSFETRSTHEAQQKILQSSQARLPIGQALHHSIHFSPSTFSHSVHATCKSSDSTKSSWHYSLSRRFFRVLLTNPRMLLRIFFIVLVFISLTRFIIAHQMRPSLVWLSKSLKTSPIFVSSVFYVTSAAAALHPQGINPSGKSAACRVMADHGSHVHRLASGCDQTAFQSRQTLRCKFECARVWPFSCLYDCHRTSFGHWLLNKSRQIRSSREMYCKIAL